MGQIETQVKGYRGLWSESEDLNRSLNMLAAGMDDEIVKHGGAPRSAVSKAYGKEMRCLTHDIEDCLERFLHRVTRKRGASRFHKTTHALKTIPRCLRFARKMKKLKKRLDGARNRVFQPSLPSDATSVVPTSATEGRIHSPAGITEATKHLLALLEKPNLFSLIAILGFGGSGKTTLVRALYNCTLQDKFSCAWVSCNSLESHNSGGILLELQKQLLPEVQCSDSTLSDYLSKQKRYLIVLDGVKMEHMDNWKSLRHALKGSGGVLATTSFQSVATALTSGCTPGNNFSPSEEADKVEAFGYVYRMGPLSKENSQAIALAGRCAPELIQGSAKLLDKCDGHPLALSCVANLLRSQDEPTGRFCLELSRSLGSYLEQNEFDEPYFARLRTVLFDAYGRLPDHFVRTCLLYLCIFPASRPISRDVIIR